MAITTYAELQTAVATWLARVGDTDVTDNVPDFIALAEAQINRVLRVREQEETADLTVSAQAVALPTNFIGVRRVYLSTDPLQKLPYMAPDAFWQAFSDTSLGKPTAFTIEGEYIKFGPSPDATYTAKLLYWERQDVSASAHAMFTRNPDLYLFGALMEAAPFMNEPDNEGRFATFAKRYAMALDAIAKSDAKDRSTGGEMRVDFDTMGV